MLYEGDEGIWRFALGTTRSGIVDRRIADAYTTADEAKAALLEQLRRTEAVVIDGEWTTERAGWWSCVLVPAPERIDGG